MEGEVPLTFVDKVSEISSAGVARAGDDAALWSSRLCFREFSRTEISDSRSFNTSCKRIISISRLDTDRSAWFGTPLGTEIERLGRELCSKEFKVEVEFEFDREWECECELRLEKEVLRE